MSYSIPKTMKAAQVVEHGKPVQVKEVPVPEPGPRQILVKIQASGVCHTDLHVAAGDWGDGAKCPLPTTLGHEGVGIVVKVGSDVKDVPLGTRVGIPWLHQSCGKCRECWAGWETTCTKQLQSGFSTNGALSEYALANPAFVGLIPAGLSDEQAAPILCAGVTTYKGLKESGVKPGQYIVITGAAGGLGHVAVQYAKAMGMIVIAVDGGESKMQFLKRLGADHVIDFKVTKDVSAEIKRITANTEGPHGALMLAAVAPLFTQAVKYMRPRGTVVCIALPPGNFEVPVLDIILKAVSVKGSIVGTRLDLQEALEIAAAGKVKCNVVTKPLSDIQAVLDDLHHMKIEGRVCIDFKRSNSPARSSSPGRAGSPRGGSPRKY